jgi:hypothetical protein
VKYQLISTKSTLFRCIVFSWFITQGFSVQGWHCWSWHNPNAFQLYALCCSYLPTVASSLTSLSVDKYSTHGAYELVWTSCMYVHVKSPIHHDTSLFPLLKCQRCGMPHFFGEKKMGSKFCRLRSKLPSPMGLVRQFAWAVGATATPRRAMSCAGPLSLQ